MTKILWDDKFDKLDGCYLEEVRSQINKMAQKLEDYSQGITGDGKSLTDKKPVSALKYLLDVAYKQLNLELEFFWKRSTYFAVMIGALIAGMAAIYAGYLQSNGGANPPPLCILLFLSLVGFGLSSAWYRASRFNKYWYEVWEVKVRLLEEKLLGSVHSSRFVFIS